nr:hypothetical protein [Tanacetum cinerariifolium]
MIPTTRSNRSLTPLSLTRHPNHHPLPQPPLHYRHTIFITTTVPSPLPSTTPPHHLHRDHPHLVTIITFVTTSSTPSPQPPQPSHHHHYSTIGLGCVWQYHHYKAKGMFGLGVNEIKGAFGLAVKTAGLLELMLSRRSKKNTKCVKAADEELIAAKHKLMLLVYCC